jgi:alpha-mannosidase
VEGRPYGFSLLNDCKYGYDVLNGELRMSILRSPVYAFHQPRQLEDGVVYHYTDQGEQTVHLALVPHAGTWVEGDVVRSAESLNVPPVVGEVDQHAGPWPSAASLLRCEPSNVVLAVFKVAEEGEDLILRGYETAGRETTAQIEFGPEGSRACWPVMWRPYEIKTLRLGLGDGLPVEVSMLEEEAQ